jgi:hypothetical protein
VNSITLLNNTAFDAQYVVKKGEQTIAFIAAVAPNATVQIPTTETFEVQATTVIDGNTYTSALSSVQDGMGYLAQVLQASGQGTYVFDVQEMPAALPTTLSFQKTCLSPVTFTITKNGVPLQNVLVHDSNVQTLNVGDAFYVYAVVNGVTTATSTFTNPSATVTAVSGTSDLEYGSPTLVIS